MDAVSWDDVRCFVAVAKWGSLSGARSETGLSIATLGRRVDALEASLGLKLFRRGRNGARLTDEGTEILRLAEPGVRQLSQLVRLARTLQSERQSVATRISATETVIADILAPQLGKLLERDAESRIELEVSNALTNLNEGVSDLAIRMVKPEDTRLIARRMPPIRMGLFCSREYFSRRQPQVKSLAKERLLWLDSHYGPIPENRWLDARRLESAVFMRSSSVRSLVSAASAGMGIAPLPAYSAKAADLVELTGADLPVRQLWMMYHRDSKGIKRMQVVRDWVGECFATISA
jgi:DNA-binding transcriptional LysR family regulator